jgi:hypothetical protein
MCQKESKSFIIIIKYWTLFWNLLESLTTIKDTEPGGKLTKDPSDPDPQNCEKSNIIEQLINKDSLLQTLKLPDTRSNCVQELSPT